jgi:leucyl/phenylalanyl-tRNA--protein transferase
MGEGENHIAWFEASQRAIMPIELKSSEIKISRSLKQVINRQKYKITIDKAFEKVILECSKRDETWINGLITNAYTELFYKGFAHSIEAWENGELAGGLYGVAYKGAFFGESMFFRQSNASKVCVVKLYEMLKKNKFILFDIQMMTPHFEKFGAIEISKRTYLEILSKAMDIERKFK